MYSHPFPGRALWFFLIVLLSKGVNCETSPMDIPSPNLSEPLPSINSDWPHTGAYGLGTRYLYLKNFLQVDITIDVNAGTAPKNQHIFLPAGKDSIFEVPN